MTSREFSERVLRRAKKAGVTPDSLLLAGLESYFRLLESWNRKINLTALDLENGGDSMVDRLLIEPLVAASHVAAGTAAVIDIGSGGGSPAIPMQLALPNIPFTLVEVKTRKCAFLREAARHLHLDTYVETARFETLLANPEMHERFDLLTMRAVRLEGKVLVGLQSFVRGDGRFFLFRGPSGTEIPTLLAQPLVWEATYPLIEQSRLVVLRKQDVVGY